jgi:transcriptional regulator with XRE-family HTH domain
MSLSPSDPNRLGAYLKDRRAKLDPASFGLPLARRRTPGLRREEVAQRAHVSATWYTWLEQGRGGAPSADVLDRISRALMLTDVEREHLFLIGLGRPPEVRYQPQGGITPRLQRVLDSLETSPAYIRNSGWDILAWNRAAAVVLTDYREIPPGERNLLRLIFSSPGVREKNKHWEPVARWAVASFRADVARAGATESVAGLVDELRRASPEFDAIWRDNDVQNSYGEVSKTFQFPLVGAITLDYSAFAVDGRPDLSLVAFTPSTLEDSSKVRRLMDSQQAGDQVGVS